MTFLANTPKASGALRYTLLINAAPQSSQGAKTALRFAESLLQMGHNIERLFFYGDGVLNASSLSVMPQDEINIPAA
jgi:tRNA 2-thiouridine synthesizing protein D